MQESALHDLKVFGRFLNKLKSVTSLFNSIDELKMLLVMTFIIFGGISETVTLRQVLAIEKLFY